MIDPVFIAPLFGAAPAVNVPVSPSGHAAGPPEPSQRLTTTASDEPLMT